MEEFKNLKEIIELCKEELENNDENTHATLDLVDLKELKNLINKNKELEEQIEEYKLNAKENEHEAQENARLFRKEQAKKNEYKEIVEFMASFIWKYDCCKHEIIEDGKCKGLYKEKDCAEKCIIDYFRKKAKGE